MVFKCFLNRDEITKESRLNSHKKKTNKTPNKKKKPSTPLTFWKCLKTCFSHFPCLVFIVPCSRTLPEVQLFSVPESKEVLLPRTCVPQRFVFPMVLFGFFCCIFFLIYLLVLLGIYFEIKYLSLQCKQEQPQQERKNGSPHNMDLGHFLNT